MTPGSVPASPSERRTGSRRNPKGSASSAGDIDFSEKLESAIRNMVSQHNAKMKKDGKPEWSRTSTRTVAAVVRRGMGAFSSSHRPGMNRQQWGLARARAFLHLLSTGKPRNSKYTVDNDLLPKGHPRSSKGRKADDMDNLEFDVVKEQVENHIDEMILADVEDDLEEIDITDDLTEEQIQELFDAFEDGDWEEVDRILDNFEKEGIYRLLDEKAEGGLDRNRGGAEKLRRYWTVGKGGAKIRWGTDGDWTRCVKQLSKYLGPRAKGYCSLRHKEMNGYWPGDKRNKSDSMEDIEFTSIYDESKQFDLGEPMMEHKTVGVTGMKVLSENDGIVETIISVTGIVDNVKDRILPGAYQKTLAKRKPKGVWSHDWDTPVSKTVDVKELLPGDPELPTMMPNGDPWPSGAGALKVKTQFNLETQRGREAYSDVVFFGDEQEWSIGYNVPVGGAKVDQKSGVREISMLELYEYSPVLFGAMPLARTTSVKEAQLALKALKGGAAAWLAEQADMDEEEEKEYTSEDMEDDEEMEDDMEGKSRELSADQMILVKRAIDTLSDLLEVVQGAESKGGSYMPMGKDKDKDKGGDMSDMDKEVMPDEEKEEDEDYGSLSDAVGDMLGDEQTGNFMKAAEAFDKALMDDDDDAAEKAMGKFLDLVEDAMGQSDDMDGKLKELAEMIADMIDSMDEEMVSEETIDKKVREDDMDLEDMQEEKREYSKERREEMAEEGMAMPDGSFPIKDRADLQNAIQAHGRAKDIEKAKAHIKKRAKELGLEDMIPEEWSEGKILINANELKSLLDSLSD